MQIGDAPQNFNTRRDGTRQRLWPLLSTTQMAVIFCETSKPTKWVIMVEPPMVRITGQRRPDRGTIGRSGTHRDYRMSRHDSAGQIETRRDKRGIQRT
jgi:hypothetical protein